MADQESPPSTTTTATITPATTISATADTPPTAAQKRRDMESMLTYIQGARLVSMGHETAVSQVQGWLLGRFWFSLLTTTLGIGAILLVSGPLSSKPTTYSHAPFFCGIVILLFVARMGALISVGRRIKDENIDASVGADGIYALATLGSGRNGLAIALMSSNAFGLIMYALFASGLPASLGLSGGIAPVFRVSIDDLRRQLVDDRATAANAAAALNACLANPPTQTEADTGSTVADGNTADATVEPGGSDTNTIDGNASMADNAAAPDDAAPPCQDLRVASQVANVGLGVSQSALLLATGTSVAPHDTRDNGSSEPILVSIKTALGLAQVSDLFKMLIWSFIAGFFEQFVPDMLNSLAALGKARKDKAGK